MYIGFSVCVQRYVLTKGFGIIGKNKKEKCTVHEIIERIRLLK